MPNGQSKPSGTQTGGSIVKSIGEAASLPIFSAGRGCGCCAQWSGRNDQDLGRWVARLAQHLLTPEGMMGILEDLQTFLDQHYSDQQLVKVLEAGCGSASRLRLPRRVHLTGIDISQQQLERNTLLDARILGDLQTYQFEPNSFDLVVCWDVLEHLASPELAVEKLLRSAPIGGILVFKLPNVCSLKGLFTKYTPHWFHVWYYKTMLGWKDAGTRDIGPFRTFLRFSISPRRLVRRASKLGAIVALEGYYESGVQIRLRERLRLRGMVFNAAEALVRFTTLGTISIRRTEHVLVLRRINA